MDLEILALLNTNYPFFGWTGCLIIAGSSLLAALFYRGREGERYSVCNHYISELGEVGVSRLAWIFNAGMIIGGILFVLMMAGLGLSLASVWGKIAMAAGMFAGVFCALVGVFPMNDIKPHSFVAMIYFRAGLVTVLLFTIAVFVQPDGGRVLPLYVNIFSALAFAAYLLFIILVGRAEHKVNANANLLDTNEVIERKKFWIVPFLEWMVFFTTLLWFLVVATAGE